MKLAAVGAIHSADERRATAIVRLNAFHDFFPPFFVALFFNCFVYIFVFATAWQAVIVLRTLHIHTHTGHISVVSLWLLLPLDAYFSFFRYYYFTFVRRRRRRFIIIIAV